jgi:hypothetical protein
VQGVRVEAIDAVLSITVQYSVRLTDQVQVQTFTQPTGGGP